MLVRCYRTVLCYKQECESVYTFLVDCFCSTIISHFFISRLSQCMRNKVWGYVGPMNAVFWDVLTAVTRRMSSGLLYIEDGGDMFSETSGLTRATRYNTPEKYAISWGCLRTGNWEYLGRRRMMWSEGNENDITRSFMICTLRQSILRNIKSRRMRWAGHIVRMERRGPRIGYW
jgi:hypothetical protein